MQRKNLSNSDSSINNCIKNDFGSHQLDNSNNNNSKNNNNEVITAAHNNHPASLELENLKVLIKNLEMLDRTNQLESLLSPRVTGSRKSMRAGGERPIYPSSNTTSSKATNTNSLFTKLESFNLIKTGSTDSSNYVSLMSENQLQQQQLPTTPTNGKDLLATTHSQQQEPVRVIKITEIIEINGSNNNNNNKNSINTTNNKTTSLQSEMNLDNDSSSPHNESNNKKFSNQLSQVFGHRSTPKTAVHDNYRQLPILIEEKASSSSSSSSCQKFENNSSDKKSNDNSNHYESSSSSKNAEIVLEIINIIDDGGGKEPASKSHSSSQDMLAETTASAIVNSSSDLNHFLLNNHPHLSEAVAIGSGKSKKITIRITGRTRSTSTDTKNSNNNALLQSGNVSACIKEPILVEDVTGK